MTQAKEKILVVDDDFFIRQFMMTVLQSSGYTCEGVEDGLAAMDILQKTSFDMVITDIDLPQLDGLELLSRIRKEYPPTKVMVISGKNRHIEPEIKQKADRFLPKPFTVPLFLSTVENVLRQP